MSNQYSQPPPIFQAHFYGNPNPEPVIWQNSQGPDEVTLPNPYNKFYFNGMDQYVQWNDTTRQLNILKSGLYEIHFNVSVNWVFTVPNPNDVFGFIISMQVYSPPPDEKLRGVFISQIYDAYNVNPVIPNSPTGRIENGAVSIVDRLDPGGLIRPILQVQGDNYTDILRIEIFEDGYSLIVKRVSD